MSRRLLFLFDGTADSAAEGSWRHQTNVFRLGLSLNVKGDQIVFYMPGVGTRGDVLSRATGRGLDQITREAYINLASNYSVGDNMYLFGFSRGAAAARALTGLVAKGLLRANELDHLDGVWRYFIGNRPAGEMEELKHYHVENRTHDKLPTTRFLGVFDTVPGRSWDKWSLFTKTRFENLRLAPQVDVGVQLLAIDETRAVFSPLLWTAKSHERQVVEQIWMPGVHGDVGGSFNGLVLRDIALLTMIDRIRVYCPELVWNSQYISELERRLQGHARIEISDERFDVMSKLLPRSSRRIGEHTFNGTLRYCNQYLHPVVDHLIHKRIRLRGKRAIYMPQNLPPEFARCSTGYDALFKEACERTLARTS